MVFFIRKLLTFVLLFETILFLVLYCFGPNGIHLFFKLKDQKAVVEQEIKNLSVQVRELEEKVALSKQDFYKEKIARERLLMKKDKEEVYFKSK